MSNYREDRPGPHPFQKGTDPHDPTSEENSAPHKQHDQLVTHFRRFIAEQQEQERDRGLTSITSPAHIIRFKLDHESGPAHTDPQTRSQAYDFWQPLIPAWDALAYDRYDPNSLHRMLATSSLSTEYKLSRQGEPVIRLNRYQAGIIDALTEAAGIPHQKGQTAIAIPEHVMANSKAVRQDMQPPFLSRKTAMKTGRLQLNIPTVANNLRVKAERSVATAKRSEPEGFSLEPSKFWTLQLKSWR